MTEAKPTSPLPENPDSRNNVADTYEAPGVETVLTPEDLEREVLYGGDGTPPTML
jgi:hypothetical protein